MLLWLAACRSAPRFVPTHPASIADLQPAALDRCSALQVVATTTLVAEVVRIVGGDDITLTTLVGPGFDPHTYEPIPPRMRAPWPTPTSSLMNGFGLEEFPGRQPAAGRFHRPFHRPLGRASRRFGLADGSGEIDPHVWLDPRNVMIWTTNAGEALARLDPDHVDGYRQRAEAYRLELEALDRRVSDGLALIPTDQRKLVTDHDTLGYFAARFGFTIVGAVVPAASSSAEASARELAALEDSIRREGRGRCSSPPRSTRTWPSGWRTIPARVWSHFTWSR